MFKVPDRTFSTQSKSAGTARSKVGTAARRTLIDLRFHISSCAEPKRGSHAPAFLTRHIALVCALPSTQKMQSNLLSAVMQSKDPRDACFASLASPDTAMVLSSASSGESSTSAVPDHCWSHLQLQAYDRADLDIPLASRTAATAGSNSLTVATEQDGALTEPADTCNEAEGRKRHDGHDAMSVDDRSGSLTIYGVHMPEGGKTILPCVHAAPAARRRCLCACQCVALSTMPLAA